MMFDLESILNSLTFIDYYFIGINIAGFLFACLNSLLYRFTEDSSIDFIVTFCSTFGGSLGVIISLLMFERLLFSKHKKDIMMSRVYVVCMFIIQMVLYLYLKGYHIEVLNLDFMRFFLDNKIISFYLVIINLITFIAFGIDKELAKRRMNRIRIVTLLFLALIGGSIGALCGMLSFKHKTSIDYFMIGVPLIICAQVAVIFYLMNSNIEFIKNFI